MANVIGIVGVVVTGVALLMAVLACALPYWTVVDSTSEISIGLWRFCISVFDETECGTISTDNGLLTLSDEYVDDINVVKAMVVVGLVLLVPGIIIGILVLFVMKDKKILFFVAGIINIVAGLVLMVGFAYYVSDVYDDDVPDSGLGAAFALDIVAWIMAWVAGALFIVAKIMDKE